MKHILILVTVFFIVTIMACQVAQIPSPGAKGAQFDDIPVPDGFVQDNFHSYGYIFSTFKVYTQLFKGNRKLEYIYNFYKGLMPRNGWQLVSENIGSESWEYKKLITMTYVNTIEQCIIKIYYEHKDTVAIRIDRNLK